MYKRSIYDNGLFLFAVITAAFSALVGPLIYHIVWCINAASETGSAIGLLIVGVLIPPVGWVHGVSLLLGFTWI